MVNNNLPPGCSSPDGGMDARPEEKLTDPHIKKPLLDLKQWCLDYADNIDSWIETNDKSMVEKHLDKMDKMADEL